MGLGREVADAYISVHGDLSPFRRDLEKANDGMEKWAKDNADTAAEAWGKRMKEDWARQWDSVVQSMYSGKQVDFNRMLGSFDATDLDHASEKLHEFIGTMNELGKVSDDQAAGWLANIDKEIKALQRQEFLERDLAQNREQWGQAHKVMMAQLADARDKAAKDEASMWDEAMKANAAYDDRRRKTMEEAIKENERWARTLDGIRKNNAIRDLNADFQRLAQTMSSADMGNFAKGFDSLTEAKNRIQQITDAMQQQGRMSEEQARIMHANFDQFMRDETAKAKAMRDALDETNRLRKAQDEYNASLSGMARNIHFSELENDFRNLARAMDSNDWSHFAKGADDVDQMRDNIRRTAEEMHRLGRMTDQELSHITAQVGNVTHSFKDAENGVGFFQRAGERLKGFLPSLGGALRGTREHLQGFAGLNVFQDMMQEGLDFIHNLDRIALSASNTALKLGSMASIGGSALAGMTVIVGDLADSLGGLSALLPAFATGLGIMGYTAMTALQGMADKYKKELKAWKQDMFTELDKGLQPALDRFSKVMLPTFQKGLKDTAAAEGRMFGAILDQITKSTGPKNMELMFKRMNTAIDKSQTGVKGFVDAWARLGLVGSKYFDRFAGWINKLGTNFDNFIKKAEKSGQIDKWIEAGIKGFKDLGRVIDGTLGIFNAVESAARKAGAGGLSSFADKLQGIARTMQEAGFQKTLVTLLEGMEGAVKKVGTAIGNLGPAVASVMPSIKQALLNIGDTAAGVIGYIGQILSSPAVQKGITDFTAGMKTAMEHLAPAVKPFADSLGNAMTLLGRVIVSVADIATAFTVVLGPVIDDMSRKVQTLLTPLSDMAVGVVKALKPVADALNTYLVGPIAAALKTDLIPAVNDFVRAASPVLTKVVKDLGPVFATLAKDVLPKLLKFAQELLEPLGKLFDLFTPTFNDTLKKIAGGFGSLASAMRIAKGEARPEDWGILFHGFTNDGLNESIKKTEEQIKHVKSMGWGEILSQLLTGDMSLGLAGIGSKIGDFFTGTVGPFLVQQIGQLVAAVGGLFGGPGDPALNKLSEQVDHWIVEAFRNLFDNLLPDLQKANEGLSTTITTALNDWWGGIKGMFQDWFRTTFGFGNDSSQPAGGIITGPMAGGKGSGIMGKITDEQLGIATDPSQLIQQWFTDVQTNIGNGLQQLADSLGLSGLGPAWTDFWNGLGTTVSTAWDAIGTWVSTAYTNISTGITNFLTGFGAQWDAFWANPVATIQQAWTNITTWITTASTTISTGISAWTGGLGAQWNGFWSGMGQTVNRIWTQITTWISGQIGAIGANISGFVGAVTGQWNGFWGGVGATVSRIWSQITGTISGFVVSIIGNIAGFGGTITGIWNGIWNGARQLVSGAWSQITGAVSGGVNSVMGWIRGLPGQISGALSGLGNLLLGAGSAIMQGFMDGLTSVWNNITGFVGGIAGWIAANKGPVSYDRTLLIPAGEAIMGGFHQALVAKFGPVMDFISSIADTMAGAFAHSKMYVMGADAALGLASGFASGKTVIEAAVGSLVPDTSLAANVSGTAYGSGVGAPTPTKVINVAAGAIQVTTPTKSPELVASKTIDALVSESTF